MDPVRKLLLWCARNPWMSKKLPRTGFMRRAASRFLPGETVGDALAEAARLQSDGIESVLTLLGEDVDDAEATRRVTCHYREALGSIEDRALRAEISVKPTHLGLELERDLCAENLEVLARAAAERNRFLWIDMEASLWVEPTLAVYRELCARHDNVGLCLQAYLYRTEHDLESLLGRAAGIRLVKGAYAEPAEIAYPSKREVDASFLRLADRLLDPGVLRNGFRTGIATHDDTILSRIGEFAGRRGVAPDAYEVQMLYGIRREFQRDLVARGHRVRILISYGNAWFAWYMRRLAERPANVGFVLRSLLRG